MTIIASLVSCSPSLQRRSDEIEEDFQPFYYSYMQPGGLTSIIEKPNIRFKGTHDSENPNLVFFLIEPSTDFERRLNKVSIVLFANIIDASNECQNHGGRNDIDCVFRSQLAGAVRQDDRFACAAALQADNTFSPNLFARKLGFEFEYVVQGSAVSEAVFEISNFFNSTDQNYTHAIFIPDFNDFCRGPENQAVTSGSCMDGDYPASHCYYVADLPQIPMLLEVEDSF